MSEQERNFGDEVDEETVVEEEPATEPLTGEEVRAAQAEAAASGEAVVGVEEATDPLTPGEVREAQAGTGTRTSPDPGPRPSTE
jgi:hypothetical protein